MAAPGASAFRPPKRTDFPLRSLRVSKNLLGVDDTLAASIAVAETKLAANAAPYIDLSYVAYVLQFGREGSGGFPVRFDITGEKLMKARIFVSLAAFGFTGLALAQQGAAPSFSDVDKNSDGQISREEAQAVEGLDFSKADTNQDGHLDRQEFDAASQSKGQ